MVSGLTFLPPKRTDQLYTAFLQDEIRLIDDRLTLTAGTKLLRTNFTGFEFEPSVRLAWTPSENETVWAAFTHALRTPSDAEENFYLSGFVGIAPGGVPEMARFNANPNFAPEQMNGYELGYRRLVRKSVLVDLASFYNHYHDLFDEEFAGPVFLENNPAPVHYLLPAQFRNGLLGYTKGIGGDAGVAGHQPLAAARILLLPAYEPGKIAAFRRRGDCAGHRGIESPARSLGSVFSGHRAELSTGFDVPVREFAAGTTGAGLFHRAMPASHGARPANWNYRWWGRICFSPFIRNLEATRDPWWESGETPI